MKTPKLCPTFGVHIISRVFYMVTVCFVFKFLQSKTFGVQKSVPRVTKYCVFDKK